MKTSITASSYFPYWGEERGLVRMREDGFDAIDYGLASYQHPIYQGDEAEALAWATAFRHSVEAAGLSVCQTHGPWRWPPEDATEENRAEVMTHVKRALLVTKALGVPFMVMHPLMPFGDSANLDPKFTHAVNKAFFTEAAECAKAAGVIICLENVPMPALSLASVASINEFLEEMNSPFLQACLDTGHALVTGEAPDECVALLGCKLKCLHLHDNHGERDEHLWPGDGNIEWNKLSSALKGIGYQGVFSLETGVLIQGLGEDERRIQEKELFRRLKCLIF